MSTRSPTTIRRLGDSSGMGSSIQFSPPYGGKVAGMLGEVDVSLWRLRGRRGEPPPASFSDVDHVPRLTGLGAALLMRAGRGVAAAPPRAASLLGGRSSIPRPVRGHSHARPSRHRPD